MDPIPEARREVEELLRSYDRLGQQISEQIKRISEPMRGTAAWHAMRAIDATNRLANKIQQAQSLSAPRKWSVDSDPNVPHAFRAWYKRRMGDPRYREKFHRLQNSLAQGQTPKQADCLLDLNAAYQFLFLAQTHHRSELKADSRRVLYERIRGLHHKVFGCYPTNLDRTLKNIGLGLFFPFGRGRPPEK
jgi:hypothetical protein